LAWCGALVLGLTLLGLAFLWDRTPSWVDRAGIDARAAAVAQREGIIIGMGDPASFFVPPYPPVFARLVGGDTTPIADGETISPALDGIEAALRAYPPGFFAANCKAIFLCGSLTLDGASAGGTWRGSWIILAVNPRYGRQGIYDNVWHGVHHEFSSLVWVRFPELRDRWRALLPADWVPSTRYAEALKASGALSADADQGFLSPYGATNDENDFNSYAEAVFVDPSHVARQADKHPEVARKLALLLDAYLQLDSRFKVVFESLGLWRFRSPRTAPFMEGMTVSPIVVPAGQILPEARP
jgi:hypothetical protein